MMRARIISVIAALALLTGSAVALAATIGPSPSAGKPRSTHPTTHASPISSVSAQPPSAVGGRSAMVACPDLSTTTSGSLGGAATTATHIFTRTTADGVTIRVYQFPATSIGCGAVPTVAGPAVTGLEPPFLSCGASSDSIEMSDATAVGQADLESDPSPATLNAGTEPQSTDSGTFGVVEGDPVWWVAMHVDTDVATGRVTFADGSTDTMAPVDGTVVLAHHVAASATSDPYDVAGTVQLLDASGNVLRTVTLPQPPVVSPPPVPLPPPTPMPVPQTGGGVSASGSAKVLHGRVNLSGAGTSPDTAATSEPPIFTPATPVIVCPMVPLANAAGSAPSTK